MTGDLFDGGMGTVAGAEGIVDVNIDALGQLGGESRIVLGLPG